MGSWGVLILSLPYSTVMSITLLHSISHWICDEWKTNKLSNKPLFACELECQTRKVLNKYKHWNSWSFAFINSLRPNDAIWRPRSGSKLVYVMAWLPDGTKPLAKPIDGLTHWHLRDLNTILNELFLKPVLMINGWAICWEIALRRMSLDIANDESTLV